MHSRSWRRHNGSGTGHGFGSTGSRIDVVRNDLVVSAFLFQACSAQDISNLLGHEQLQRVVRSPAARARVCRLDAPVLCLGNASVASEEEAAEARLFEHMSQ